MTVLAGQADRAVPADAQRELSAWLERSRFQVIRGAGHNVVVERPGELVSAVRMLETARPEELVAA